MRRTLLLLAVLAQTAMVPPQVPPGDQSPVPTAPDSIAAALLRLEVGQAALRAELDSLFRAQAAGDGRVAASRDSLTAALLRLERGQAALRAGLDSLRRAPAEAEVAVEAPDSAGEVPAQPPDSAAAEGSVQAADSTAGAAQRAGEVIGSARDLGVNIVLSMFVVVLFLWVVRSLTWVLDTLSERSARRRLFYKRLVPIVRIVLWIFAGYLIISVIFQVSAQGLLAAGAAVGVAVGFAAQDLLKNLFGGVILVFDQPFQVGDKVSVGGTYGEVVSVGLRSTRIVTADDNLVSVPNAQVVDGHVANANAGELNCQVVTELYLPGFIDESVAKKIAFDAAASSKYVFLKKPIVVLVKDIFKETFLTQIKVKAYVLDPRYEFLFQSDVTERARAGFREAGLLQPHHGMRAWVDVSAGGSGGATPSPDLGPDLPEVSPVNPEPGTGVSGSDASLSPEGEIS